MDEQPDDFNTGIDRLTALPTEIGQLIADELNGSDLKSFRLATKRTAALGYRALREWIPETIRFESNFKCHSNARFGTPVRARTHESFSADRFVGDLVSVMQERLPEAAAKITSLSIKDNLYSHSEISSTPAIKSIRLPSLQALVLESMIIPADQLLALLRNHKGTLRRLRIQNIAIAGHNMDPSTRYLQWRRVLVFIQKHMRLETIQIKNLHGHDVDNGDTSISIVKTPKTKYHARRLSEDIHDRRRWQLSGEGFEAFGGAKAVRSGLLEYLREIERVAKTSR